jgi:beta-galactosidase
MVVGKAAVCAALLFAALPVVGAVGPRVVLKADSNWKFHLGDASGAEARSFDDQGWRTVQLPHDWSIDGRPEKDNPTGAGGGFYPAGTGWYRKTFTAPAEWKGKRVSVEFDGVYRDATVYLNGRKLGTQPYGYTSFAFDMTPELDFAGKNVLAVRVDNSEQPNSRWYTGSGIYRHVRVVVTEAAHVAHWGVFVTTKEATESSATVAVRTRVANESGAGAGLRVETALVDGAGKTVGRAETAVSVAAGSEGEARQEIAVAAPKLWSPETPVMYRAVTRVVRDGRVVDEVETPFGIRTIAWSAEKGFLLNGRTIKFVGGSVHHDNGPLGAAAFDRAEERRVELLKAAGFNAVRTAHNPPSPGFLEACDRVGLLVMDEPFDAWKASKVKYDYGRDFDQWWRRDISAMVMRDRNHPSVVIWSIGNEIPEVEVERGPRMARELAEQVRTLDDTRPLTLAFPGSTSTPTADGVFSVLDITGYNYNLARNYEADHRRVPSRLMLTTESYPSVAFENWRLTKENPYISGEFVWTAMDYLGESGIGAWAYGTPEQVAMAGKISGMMQDTSIVDKLFLAMANGVDAMAEMAKGNGNAGMQGAMALMFPGYPWHASNCGDLDLTGYRKPQSYYRDILWNGGDRVYATVRLPEPEGKKIIALGWAVVPTMPNWTWPGEEGKTMQVEVYSGVEKVRLYLNGKLTGEKPAGEAEQFQATFDVPYAPGTLKAEGVKGGRVVAESVIETAGKAARLRLQADRRVLRADGEDLAFVTVEAVDGKGRPVMNADEEVQFALDGPGQIQAVGNGDGRDDASYQGTQRKLYGGRALVVVRTMKKGGTIRLKATAAGLRGAEAVMQAKEEAAGPELE